MTTLTDEELLAWLEEISQLEYVGERDANNAKQTAARVRELLAERRAFIATLSGHAMQLNKLVSDLEPVTAISPKRPLPAPPKDG